MFERSEAPEEIIPLMVSESNHWNGPNLKG
jgi:hypothetical protein